MLIILIAKAVLCFSQNSGTPSSFVQKKGMEFQLNGVAYHYIGANYWYGALLGIDKINQKRLKTELSFLKAEGVENLRILAGAEGIGKNNGMPRTAPPLQPKEGIFDPKVLQGLDFLLSEMGKRKMHAVIYLSNNWEWSGGFLQYVNWSGALSEQEMNAKMTWDQQKKYVSYFYDCERCIQAYRKQVATIINRRNIYTHRAYKDDPTIMAWELGNEPRPMLSSFSALFSQWVNGASRYIRSLDSHHLITIGSEGIAGTDGDLKLFEQIHAYKDIDYLTIHIWPKNWGYFQDTAIEKSWANILDNSANYIDKHVSVARTLGKPLVIEEFGLPRDQLSYSPDSKTRLRDRYFQFIFTQYEQKELAGCNFWAFGGSGRPHKGHLFWQNKDMWIGDPPNEEQGLNTVYDRDRSTWEIIESFIRR